LKKEGKDIRAAMGGRERDINEKGRGGRPKGCPRKNRSEKKKIWGVKTIQRGKKKKNGIRGAM